MTQQRLINDIERACDIMRRDNNCSGVMDYVEHLSWLLFLKFLDVRYQLGKTDDTKPQHPLDPMYRWSEWVPKALSKKGGYNDYKSLGKSSDLLPFIQQELLPYLAALSGSPERDLIASIFKEPHVVVCASIDNLKEVLKIVDDIDLEQEDEIQTVAETYEVLLQKLGQENRTAGEFYIPRAVVSFVVEAINPQLGESIYDPCCGSGAFLAATYDHLKEQIQSREQAEALQQTTIVGHVKNVIPSLFSSLNLLVHGATATCVSRKNALEEETEHTSSRFDIVLTNPPFGGKENERTQQNFPIRSSASELLYLQHIMGKLSSHAGARCCIILPEGVLFRHDGAFVTVKKELLESFSLFMVVSLPRGVFAPYSSVKTSLLFFERPGPTKEVLYYEISSPERGRSLLNSNSTFETSLHETTNIYKQWRAYQAGSGSRPQSTPTCWIETMERLVKRGYDLSARNPNEPTDRNQRLPRPTEITAGLLEHHREFYQLLEHLHEIVSGHESL